MALVLFAPPASTYEIDQFPDLRLRIHSPVVISPRELVEMEGQPLPSDAAPRSQLPVQAIAGHARRVLTERRERGKVRRAPGAQHAPDDLGVAAWQHARAHAVLG